MKFRFLPIVRAVALILVPMLIVAARADAAGFDASYRVYKGYFNSDALVDLYVKSSRGAIVVAVDDIPIVIPPPVKSFVLESNANGTFNLISEFSPEERTALASWPAADVEVSLRDVDMNGNGDLDLLRVSSVVPGALDQIILSDRIGGVAPKKIVAKTAKFRAFHNDLLAALLHPNYFEDNVPLRVTSSTEPQSRLYYGSIITSGSFSSAGFVLARCKLSYPGGRCYLTSLDPSPCVQSGAQFNDQNEYIGEGTRNVCNDYAHVFVYVPGSVQVQADYSVFDTDAMEAAEILERLLNDCTQFTPGPDQTTINGILSDIFGTPIGLSSPAPGLWPNSTTHPPAPGDELFSQADPTYHHYDVRTKVCSAGEANCTVSAVSVRAEYYTYPSFQLQPMETILDGRELPVYVPFFPWQVDNPSAYTWELGSITQRRAQSGYWSEAIQNVTTPDHFMYPGTMTRKIFQEGNTVVIRSHGIGVNRTWCVPNPLPHPSTYGVTQGARMTLATLNDYFGEKSFRVLDRVFISAWRTQNGYPAATQVNSHHGAVAISVRQQ